MGTLADLLASEEISKELDKAFDNGYNKALEDIAERISQNDCSACICKGYCDEHYDFEIGSCQQTILGWLKEY